jgi:hypothetical protein
MYLSLLMESAPVSTITVRRQMISSCSWFRSLISSLILLSSPLYGGAAAAADASQGAPLKAGWSDQELSSFTAGCVLAIVTPARRDYAARAAERGISSPKPFPEKEVTASVQPMCSCIGLRIAQSWELQEFALNHEALGKPLIEEAMKGGQCKPAGLLGAMIEQRTKD